MSTVTVLGAALVLLLLSFPLVSAGSTGDSPALWWLGIALIAVGGLIPPVARYLIAEDDDD